MKNVTRGQLKKRSNSNKQMKNAFDVTMKQMKMMHGDLGARFDKEPKKFATEFDNRLKKNFNSIKSGTTNRKKAGGIVKKTKSHRGDGIAKRGRTKGRIV